jgi:hypothetical protein
MPRYTASNIVSIFIRFADRFRLNRNRTPLFCFPYYFTDASFPFCLASFEVRFSFVYPSLSFVTRFVHVAGQKYQSGRYANLRSLTVFFVYKNHKLVSGLLLASCLAVRNDGTSPPALAKREGASLRGTTQSSKCVTVF